MTSIHGLCLIKNEADIIEECLRAAARWCDHIYVWDNGSTDGTWEIVRRLARELRQVIPWRQLDTPFNDGLRKEIYYEFAKLAQPHDWWCRLDADEFYVQDPRTFLYSVPQAYDVVWYASLSYYFSSAAAAEYEKNPTAFDYGVPVEQKCRYYYNHWSEPRFVRQSFMRTVKWDSDQGWPPLGTARVCPIRIVCKHYAYRSPKQIELRIETRKKAALSGKVFSHEAIQDWARVVDPEAIQQHRWRDVAYCTDAQLFEHGWRSRVIPVSSLNFDAYDGRFVLNHHLMPPLPTGPQPSIAQDVTGLAKRVIRSTARRLLQARA